MKRLRISIIIAMAALCAVGAMARKTLKVEKPDLENIKQQVLNPKSEFYFPKLEKKYLANDTVMTPEQYRYFYLGYMFQEDYDPYRESKHSAQVEPLRKKGGNYTKKELDTIISASERVLEDNPFDLRQMSFLIHALKEKKKDLRAKIWEYRLENLLGAIKSTGTGEDIDNAWYVIYPMHEYDMMQLLGYESTDAEYPAEGIDRLIVRPTAETTKRLRGKTADSFYFNVAIPQAQYDLKHPDELEEEDETESTTE
jgi:hypothetical protein